jgi:transposase
MDRDSLKAMLEQGLSLNEIGRRFDRHESTVGYWVRKHGLEAVNAGLRAPRGALSRARVESLAESGMSIAQIAVETERSRTTVRHWMRSYGIKTRAQRDRPGSTARAKKEGRAILLRKCRTHGLTEFWLEGRGYYRCKRCRAERVSDRRRKIKQILISEAGGRCVLCGYERCVAALHFHHVDPATKSFHLSMQGVSRSLRAARAEMAKCVLLCANCHAEVEQGSAVLPPEAVRSAVP